MASPAVTPTKEPLEGATTAATGSKLLNQDLLPKFDSTDDARESTEVETAAAKAAFTLHATSSGGQLGHAQIEDALASAPCVTGSGLWFSDCTNHCACAP